MAKKTDARGVIHLACTTCQERTYTSSKNKKNDTQRLELKKYCPRCRVHTLHKETK
jgi:large subunit ribosomal protein L33